MRIEMHTHTGGASVCAKVPAKEVVRLHAAAGIDAIVITNHFNDNTVEIHPGTPRERVDHFLRGYYEAREEGERLGVTVLLGMESCIVGGREDFLVYGIDADFYYEHPTFFRYTQQEAFSACCEYGALLLQAHPFRSYCHPRDPKLLHGVEVYNGNPRHDSHNDLAKAWAIENGLWLHTSGSDFHQTEDCGIGGIVIDGTVSTSKELGDWLKNKPYTLIGK